MKKFLIIFSFLMLISFSVAQPPAFQETTFLFEGIELETPVIIFHEQGGDFEFHTHAHNVSDGLSLKNDSTSCIIHIYRGNGTHLISSNMSFDINDNLDFEYSVLGGNFTELGEYSTLFYCEVPNQIGGFFQYGFIVTSAGKELSLWDALVRMFLILFFVGLIASIHLLTSKIDFKKWNESIIKKYKTKNVIKLVLSAFLFNLMHNIFIIYYLLGLPILMIIANLTYLYGIEGLITFMNVVLMIYTVGILVVGLVFLSYVQEWIINLIEMVRDMDWGIGGVR